MATIENPPERGVTLREAAHKFSGPLCEFSTVAGVAHAKREDVAAGLSLLGAHEILDELETTASEFV